MSIIKAIYNAPVTKNVNEFNRTVAVLLEYNGYTYFGTAHCSEKDADSFSVELGYNIALSRARIQALKYFREQTEQESKWKWHMYMELLISRKNTNLDMYAHCVRVERRLDKISRAIKREKKNLRELCKGKLN